MAAIGFAQFVIGPAGSGKSTYCKVMQSFGEVHKRTFKVINLDPAADNFKYKCDVDVRDLINLDDVMEEMGYGPNGGLVYCMEYLKNNIDWLFDEIDEFCEDSYLLFDCPGQIELYSHLDIMNIIVNRVQTLGYSVCTIFCLDSTFLADNSKFISASLVSLSTMLNMAVPNINLITKCDKFPNKKLLDRLMDSDFSEVFSMKEDEFVGFNKKYASLTHKLKNIVEEHGAVSFIPLNIQDEDNLERVLFQVDNTLQYGENIEPKNQLYDDDNEREMAEEDEDMIRT